MRTISIIICLLFVQSVIAKCYEPFSHSDDLINRYSTDEIWTINKKADDVEKIKVWVDTPNCTEWTYRGCTTECIVTGRECNSIGSYLPILHSSCWNTYRKETHYVYDQHKTLKSDAPVRSKIGGCFFHLRFCYDKY
ncbi:MAG: hypothetical protein PHG66_06500 [Candidatus Colwellbacteria bacterium]|nr:hypothetical protein [Candidatus Colwellbacteria bacterium]